MTKPKPFPGSSCGAVLLALLLLGPGVQCRGEALLQLFNVNWEELAQKMPEIAEAGYTSLWLPPPAKAGSGYSVGYDLFDPFDLGDKNQRGTVPTRHGTKEQLLNAVEMAHRFGLRVYFDNVMNHRGFEVPGYNSSTPISLYPGLRPQDFHLQTIAGGYYRNWPDVGDWGDVFEVQHQPLLGLIDLAIEPGTMNNNFGGYLTATTPKISFIRHPGANSYYMDTNLPAIAGPWHPFNGGAGDPKAEDVNAYVVRSALWFLNETRCDGFRLDAVKHVPAGFFGDTYDSPSGYTGAIQAMFDQVHGYGNNLLGNGYVEAGGNRDSLFDTETARNDALLFGEHLGEPPSFGDYLGRGMRLLNVPFHSQLNNVLGNPGATLAGLEQRDYRPSGNAFTGPQSVLFAQSHDDGYAKARELHNAYNFTREGVPSIYSDGYNQSTAGPGEQPFPRVAYAPYLGQFGDNKMPDVAYLHHQLARGGTRSRWGDNDVVAFERYDYREAADAYNNADATVVLFAMNDNSASDISFDDGAAQTTAGTYYECFPVSNSRGQGLVVGFPPGTVLWQLADSPHKTTACPKLLVRQATASLAEAQATANDPNPANRKVYVGSQALFPGGGAIELKIPRNSYVAYGLQWPEASRVALGDAITLRQGGTEAPRMLVQRRDGVDGDAGFNPVYPFKMRGSLNPNGNVIPGTNVAARTYVIDVPVLTNGSFDIVFRSDASTVSSLLKLDGGVDLNSQMGLQPVAGMDKRDNRPGVATDVFLGYERALNQFRYGPEKFAARSVGRNNVTSLGAETYHYTVGGTQTVVNGGGNGADIHTGTADWVYHDPAATITLSAGDTLTHRTPLTPGPGALVQIYVKVGYKFRTNRSFIYYTTDGSSPEGAFGRGGGGTKVVEAFWAGPDAADPNIDWWSGTLPAHLGGTEVRYKVALFHDNIDPIDQSDEAKAFGLAHAAVTNFNPVNATVWLHNNLNTNHTVTGLQEGFHIVRARAFLPRSGKASVFNTFLQTFYYDAQPPAGAIAFPQADGANISSSSYEFVVRADSSTTGVEFNIADSNPANDDAITGLPNGNGSLGGAPRFVNATLTNANATLSAQYPAFPREYRFTYQPVPSSGSATITVRLRESSTSVITNRLTTLTRTVNTLGPAATVTIGAPPDGSLLVLTPTNVTTIRACFTSALTTTNTELFSVLINGVLQPRSGYMILAPGGSCGMSNRTLLYNWSNATPGTNTVQVVYTNFATVIQGSVRVAVARPGDSDNDGMTDAGEVIAGTDPYDPGSILRITELGNGNQLVVWDSRPDRRYQVLATMNLAQPMQPISPIIQGSSGSSFYFDTSPDPVKKFYRIQLVP